MTEKKHECKANKKVERLENGVRNFVNDVFTLFLADILVVISIIMFFSSPYWWAKGWFFALSALSVGLSIAVKLKILVCISWSEKNVTKRNKK